MIKAKSDLVYVFKDEEGAAQITPNALRELVRVSIPGVHSPSTQILKILKRSGYHELNVEPDCKVKEISHS